jgi:hypothetical protein
MQENAGNARGGRGTVCSETHVHPARNDNAIVGQCLPQLQSGEFFGIILISYV